MLRSSRVGQQRGERGAHHDRRQHERGGQEPEQQAPAGEPVPGEHVGRGDADDECQRRADHGLPGGEPRHLPRAAPTEDLANVVDVDGVDEQRHERQDVEDDEERQRSGGERGEEPARQSVRPSPRSPQERTISVHWSIHVERFASISAGSSVSGASGTAAKSTNSGRQLDGRVGRVHEQRQRELTLEPLRGEEVDELSGFLG